jgi:Fic family protein
VFKPNFRITTKTIRNLVQIEKLKSSIEDMPINASLLKSLRETALLTATHYSTQIEGNLLTLPEVAKVKAGSKVPGRERDEIEVRNHFKAFSRMEALAASKRYVVENDIKALHALVMVGKAKSSPYRNQQNVIRESGSGRIVYLPPEPHDVPNLMQELIAWIRHRLASDEFPVPIIAAVAHYQFATIHPYMDGNGRTARLLATLILRQNGYGLKGIYSLDEHYAKNLRAYYNALTVGSHNYYEGRAEADITAFVDYFCNGMEDAFRKISLTAAREVKAAPAKNDQAAFLRKLDPRQRSLLTLFGDQGSATAIEMAKHLKLSPRTLNGLAPQWVETGFLELANPSRKARSYRLAKAIEKKLK